MTPKEADDLKKRVGIDLNNDLQRMPFIRFDPTTGEILETGTMGRAAIQLNAYFTGDYLIENVTQAEMATKVVDPSTHRVVLRTTLQRKLKAKKK